MKIYIAGPISGIEDHNEKAFRDIQSLLEKEHHTCLVPHDISPYDQGKTWEDYMKDCIPAMCQCDAIYLLKDWYSSRGARLEESIARSIGLRILEQ